MSYHTAQVELMMTSQVTADAVTNIWHFDTAVAEPPDSVFSDIAGDLATYYGAVQGLLSSSLATTGHTINFYDMTQPTPRSPVFTVAFGLTIAATSTLPHEVAIVSSFFSEPPPGVPQARRRGRHYIGPLTSGVVGTDGFVTPVARNTMTNAAVAMAGASSGSSDYDWCTYSTVDAALEPVTGGFINNNFDTQRRRGRESTLRNPWVTP